MDAADQEFVLAEKSLRKARKLKALEENEARWKAYNSHVTLQQESKAAEKAQQREWLLELSQKEQLQAQLNVQKKQKAKLAVLEA